MLSKNNYNEFIDKTLNKINTIIDTMDRTMTKKSARYPTLTIPQCYDSKTNIYVFVTNNPISHNQYIGPGASPFYTIGNTILIYKKCILDIISFNIRELSEPIEYTAQVYLNETPTSVYAKIMNGQESFSITTTVALELKEFDSICVRLASGPNPLPNGACVTLITKQI